MLGDVDGVKADLWDAEGEKASAKGLPFIWAVGDTRDNVRPASSQCRSKLHKPVDSPCDPLGVEKPDALLPLALKDESSDLSALAWDAAAAAPASWAWVESMPIPRIRTEAVLKDAA